MKVRLIHMDHQRDVLAFTGAVKTVVKLTFMTNICMKPTTAHDYMNLQIDIMYSAFSLAYSIPQLLPGPKKFIKLK